ncbi:MAG: alpha/beta hydrolase family protein [Planctomycetota bacterium]|jgi:pimeloyl-ACP methyl ester carboxylesterase
MGEKKGTVASVAAAVVAIVGFVRASVGLGEDKGIQLDTFVLPLALGCIATALIVCFYYQSKASKKLGRDFEAEKEKANQLESKLKGTSVQLEEALADLSDAKDKLREFEANSISMIQPLEYMRVLQKLIKEHGEGNLLLFNVELNTFVDDESFKRFWVPFAQLPQVKSVQLVLPPSRFERWERIVTGVRSDYFREQGDKFTACRYEAGNGASEDRIGFALYQPLKDPEAHDWAAVFLINRPFVVERDDYYEYQQILEYKGNQEAIGQCRNLWDREFDRAWAETATGIQRYYARRRRPPSLGELLDDHDCDENRRELMTRVVGVERYAPDGSRYPKPAQLSQSRQETGDRRASFVLQFDRRPNVPGEKEEIRGYVVGLPENGEPRPCVIWASGFGDGDRPRLAEKLSRRMRRREKKLIEVFYKKSGKLEESTCTRLSEDIREVLNYVAAVPEVDADRLCIVGISISGYLAAKLAAADERVKGLVMVAPPFDVVEMLDQFRVENLQAARRIPRFEDFLKARTGLRIADWDENAEYSNYFNHVVRSCYLVDLAVKGPDEFGRGAFFRALHEITHSERQVALIFGKNDPIVDADVNLAHLTAQVQKGEIDKRNLHLLRIPYAHYLPERGPVGRYPFARTTESRELLRKMLSGMAVVIDRCLHLVRSPEEKKKELEETGTSELDIVDIADFETV